MSRGDRAYELFLQGYNCTQAVVGAFADIIGMDFDMAVRFGSGFGGGMGRLREVCGTFSGAVIVINMLYGYSDPKNVQAKAELYARIQELAAKFRQDNGSLICRELLGLSKPESSPVPEARTAEYYKKRPCPELCRYSANMVEEYISAHPPVKEQ